ncbi:hypothetical protein ABT039_18115 [Streptomyces lasiicapitis]|uniref:hypothetical protein n=1 Tax=Streptomyces lasiicapitis TaxID=1923961 RepID=UPI0033344030
MPTFTTRLDSLRVRAAATATVTAVALLLTGCSGDSDGTPACRTVHSKGGDLVPSGGVRPCIVHGSAQQSAAGGGVGRPAGSGSSNGAPVRPKTPTAPKAPAVKAPSLVKTR